MVYFDLESQKLFHEVPGGRDPSKLLLACGVTWSTERNDFAMYWEQDVQDLIAELKSADRVIGFNIISFDYEVLKPYAPDENFRAFRSTDMLQDIFLTLGFRISLDSIAKATLGTTKTADGIQSVEWFREGQLNKVAEYCKVDVEITRQVYEFGRDNGFVHYHSKLGSKLKVSVNWK
ncbi:MAG TPA: ribonuclease H-like domain-containing protein [Anaerolineales bacterium]|nr:ribonuclease H-like domain-containing protein [Anaerolineales bacterium]